MGIETLLSTFDIKRSLSHKGNPYDNAVAEANFKSLEFEFVYQNKFETLEQLQRELVDTFGGTTMRDYIHH